MAYICILCSLSALGRVLLLLWGINKFTKKLIRPWAINNNELVDFISRVPDNEELVIKKGLGHERKFKYRDKNK
jgi:hypothetical protein